MGWLGNINGWDGHMNWHTNGHTYVSGLRSWHHNGKEDRVFSPLVTNIGSTQYRRDASGWVNNMDGGFTYTCPHNKAIVGFYSYHHNGYVDTIQQLVSRHIMTTAGRTGAGGSGVVTDMQLN